MIAHKAAEAAPGDGRRQSPLVDRFRDRTDDVQRVWIDPVQDAARERYVIVIAAGDRSRRQPKHITIPNIRFRTRRGVKIAIRKPMAISIDSALGGYEAGVYQIGEV